MHFSFTLCGLFAVLRVACVVFGILYDTMLWSICVGYGRFVIGIDNKVVDGEQGVWPVGPR